MMAICSRVKLSATFTLHGGVSRQGSNEDIIRDLNIKASTKSQTSSIAECVAISSVTVQTTGMRILVKYLV